VTKRLLIISGLVFAIAVVLWIAVNPGGRFGISQYGVTTYARLPLPILDVQVRPDGTIHLVGKTHEIGLQRVDWLLKSKPEVLIVALGWTGAATLTDELTATANLRVIALPTDDALALYNDLKDRDVRVAIHVHSTC